LRDEEIGLEPADQLRVDMIKRLATFKASPNFGIDFATRHFDIERRTRADWQLPHPFRVVAFVRSPDQEFVRAETANDFGSTRQQ
jgi:hypothetical protein